MLGGARCLQILLILLAMCLSYGGTSFITLGIREGEQHWVDTDYVVARSSSLVASPSAPRGSVLSRLFRRPAAVEDPLPRLHKLTVLAGARDAGGQTCTLGCNAGEQLFSLRPNANGSGQAVKTYVNGKRVVACVNSELQKVPSRQALAGLSSCIVEGVSPSARSSAAASAEKHTRCILRVSGQVLQMKLERGQQMVVAPRNVIAWQVPARADGIPPKHLRSGTVMFQGPLELFLQGNPAKEQRLLLAGSSPEGGAKSKSVLSKSRIGAKGKLAIFTVVLGVVAYDVYKHKWDTPNIYKRRFTLLMRKATALWAALKTARSQMQLGDEGAGDGDEFVSEGMFS